VTPLHILAVNVGSSSLRIDVWDIPGTGPRVVLKADEIGSPRGTVSAGDQIEGAAGFSDHTAALDALLSRIKEPARPDAVGHRVVHGGSHYREPVWVDDRVLADLDELSSLVPLHVPPALRVIRHLRRALPHVPQTVVFDTAFHVTLPARACEYALPAEWRHQGIRRYGFHGLACADAVAELGSELRERAVLLHLGAGCSATALLRGRSLDTTMGVTPLEGLMMATRCGDLDPAILLYLQRQQGLSADELDQALNHGSGLLGLSGVSGDMKTLLARADEPAVRLALDVFSYRAAKAVGAMAVALGGCDQLIFTGGIGEHAGPIRAEIVEQLAFLGVRLDGGANAANAAVISRPESRVSVHVVRIDEGRQIARQTARLCDRASMREGGCAPPGSER
jgi:acetate kinase